MAPGRTDALKIHPQIQGSTTEQQNNRKAGKGGQHIFPPNTKKTYRCGVTGMTDEDFLTGQIKNVNTT